MKDAGDKSMLYSFRLLSHSVPVLQCKSSIGSSSSVEYLDHHKDPSTPLTSFSAIYVSPYLLFDHSLHTLAFFLLFASVPSLSPYCFSLSVFAPFKNPFIFLMGTAASYSKSVIEWHLQPLPKPSCVYPT